MSARASHEQVLQRRQTYAFKQVPSLSVVSQSFLPNVGRRASTSSRYRRPSMARPKTKDGAVVLLEINARPPTNGTKSLFREVIAHTPLFRLRKKLVRPSGSGSVSYDHSGGYLSLYVCVCMCVIHGERGRAAIAQSHPTRGFDFHVNLASNLLAIPVIQIYHSLLGCINPKLLRQSLS